jgi:UDP-N-acetylmuramoyl-L-alanyl-D-glutamate--2,6-diaminopimelate ligase
MKAAFSMMRKGDCILLLGKGHEGSIIYANHTIPWDEEDTARELLREMEFRGPQA